MFKKESQKNVLLVACLSLVILLIGYVLFEVRELPNVKWKYSFDYDDEEPYGLFVFKESISRYFEIKPTIKEAYTDTISNNGLYVYMSDSWLSDQTMDALISMAQDGNDVFLVSSSFPQQLDTSEYDHVAKQYQYADKLEFEFTQKDTSLRNQYQYQFFDQEFDLRDSVSYYLLEIDSLSDEGSLVTVANDSLALMLRYSFGSGDIFYHTMPEIFVNSSYRQEGIFEYTEDVFSLFDPRFIVLLNNVNSAVRKNNSHPLEYIMSSPSLKWAYYLLVISLLLYVIFGSKRKQKPIPIVEKNENTSLEYIETISQLFYQQDKHEKLVAHMRDVFYYRMEKKFFVKKENPFYLETLTKKSKIQESELSFVLNRFKNLEDKYSFEPDQLISLHNRIEAIYKLIDKPKKN